VPLFGCASTAPFEVLQQFGLELRPPKSRTFVFPADGVEEFLREIAATVEGRAPGHDRAGIGDDLLQELDGSGRRRDADLGVLAGAQAKL
jgi:hypothetical protein